MKVTRFAALSTAFALACGNAMAAEQMLIRVNTFPTARSLPFFVGIEQAIFARHGIRLELEFTENSQSQREGLAAASSRWCIQRSTTPSP
jgi:ABC-type nitrate/sulfonate/bicarbonate transport system substrate-binding protein